jgi:hypothetical protein
MKRNQSAQETDKKFNPSYQGLAIAFSYFAYLLAFFIVNTGYGYHKLTSKALTVPSAVPLTSPNDAPKLLDHSTVPAAVPATIISLKRVG